MKKRIITLVLGSMIAAFACSKTETVTAADCTNGATYTAALNAWTADITNKTKCQTVLTELNKLLACPGVTAAAKKEYQDLVNSNPCK
jgi:hypothetical protein